MSKIHIAYGSESGNSHALAYELKDKLSQYKPQMCELNALSLINMTDWQSDDILLIVTSTTGNGQAPHNASTFYNELVQKRMKQRMKADSTFIRGQYAVFGIGDINYENFCGFSKVVDGLLDKVGATQIANRVDADVEYEDFFELWSNAILNYLMEKESAKNELKQLVLQVNPDE